MEGDVAHLEGVERGDEARPAPRRRVEGRDVVARAAVRAEHLRELATHVERRPTCREGRHLAGRIDGDVERGRAPGVEVDLDEPAPGDAAGDVDRATRDQGVPCPSQAADGVVVPERGERQPRPVGPVRPDPVVLAGGEDASAVDDDVEHVGVRPR